MRSFVLILGLMFAGSCAHEPGRSEAAAQVVADVMVAALARTGNAESDQAWASLRTRVSPPVQWDRGGAEPVDDEPASSILQNASLEAGGWRFGVVARGSETRVRHLSIDVDDAIPTASLLDALRARGVDVPGEGDDESAMFYSLNLPGREYAQLEARRVCRPFESRADRDCRSVMTLNFQLL
jgi:hypothetical protein